MRFKLCKDEGSILSDEPIDKRALLTSCTSSPARSSADQKKACKLRVFSVSELETATGGFAKSSLLGKGSHGSSFKGTLKDGRTVTVKRLENAEDEAAFKNELEILATLQSHRYVNLVGFSQGAKLQEKLLVVEFMSKGTLHDNLHRNSLPTELLSWSMRVQIAIQIGKALLALHSASPPVIHRDLKSSSIVIDGKWNAKLGDFGLAHRGYGIDEIGVVADVDPESEASLGAQMSTKGDVFSFGILLLEMLSGRKANDARFKPPSITEWALPLIKQGKEQAIYDRRLIFEPQHAKALKLMSGIAARCVRRASLRRPSMNYVVIAVQEVSKKIPLPKWVGLANVIKRTSGCQTPDVDVRNSVEFMDDVRAAKTANIGRVWLSDKPVPSRKTFVARVSKNSPQCEIEKSQSRMVSRVNSLDRQVRLRMHMARSRAQDGAQAPELSEGKVVEEDEDNNDEDDLSRDDDLEDLPRAVTEVSSRGRRRIYNQWRNPVFDIDTKSPEETPVSRSGHHGGIPSGRVDQGRPVPSNVAAEEGSTGVPSSALSIMSIKRISWSIERSTDIGLQECHRPHHVSQKTRSVKLCTFKLCSTKVKITSLSDYFRKRVGVMGNDHFRFKCLLAWPVHHSKPACKIHDLMQF